MTTQRLEIKPTCWLDTIMVADLDSQEFISQISKYRPEKKPTVLIRGNRVPTPRYYVTWGRSYSFSKSEHCNVEGPLPEILENLKARVEDLGYGNFNGVLINWYTNGHDYIGPHSDNEKELVENEPIVSVSFGATRKFRVRDKRTKQILKDIELEDGTIVVMGGEFQKYLTHEIVKVNGKKGESLRTRVNVTFRKFRN